MMAIMKSFDNEKNDSGLADVAFKKLIFVTMQVRFEGIYEESRAVFLCNQGDGHRGSINHCRNNLRNNLGNNSRKFDKS